MCEAALATVEAQASRGRTWTPHLRFVERNATARASLRTELARFDGLLDYRVLDRPAEEVVGTLARESRGFPTFTFIDPDGIVPISFDLIRSFAGRPFTELLLSIDTMAIHRNVAAGQGVAVEALSGGTWWTEYVHANGDFDLNAYLRRLCRELATVFPVVSIEKLTFPSEHAYRAMVQCCMSQVGRKRWQPIVRKALPPGTQVLQFAAEMELDTIIERLGVLAGRTGLYYKGIMAELPDLPADDGPIHQALLYLREVGLVEWTPWLSRHAYPPPRFSFAQSWPIDLKWDRLQREPDRAPEAVVAT